MLQNKNESLLEVLVCPSCRKSLKINDGQIFCRRCHHIYLQKENAILFTQVPENINPSEFRERGTGKDTAWRRANGVFLRSQLRELSKDSLILDVGAGHGDFLPFYADFPHILLDVYPYPAVDVVCDLIQLNPFSPSSFNVVLLMNVLEHVSSPLEMLQTIRPLLKPNGRVVIAVPFYLKIHQAPLDYQRLTHYALHHLAEGAGYLVDHMEGFYDPRGVIQESLRYYRFWGSAGRGWLGRRFDQVLLSHMQVLAKLLGGSSVQPYVRDPQTVEYPAPTGYHLVLERK